MIYMIQCENGQVFHVAADDAAQAWEIVQGAARHTEPVAVNGNYDNDPDSAYADAEAYMKDMEYPGNGGRKR